MARGSLLNSTRSCLAIVEMMIPSRSPHSETVSSPHAGSLHEDLGHGHPGRQELRAPALRCPASRPRSQLGSS